MQVLEVNNSGWVKLQIDKGELQLIYQNLNESDIRKDIKNILNEIEK